MNRPILITVAISVLLHLLVMVDIIFSDALPPKAQQLPQTVDVTLLKPQPKPLQPMPEDKPPPPEHNEDDPTTKKA